MDRRRVEAMLDEADGLREHGDPAADSLYANVLSHQPQSMRALMGRALLAMRRGDRPAAHRHIEAAQQAHPRDPWPADALLDLHRQEDRWDEASGLAQDLLRAHPTHLGALMTLGLAAHRTGDAARALGWFRAAALAHPAHPWPREAELAEHRDACRWPEAEAAARALLAIAPGNLSALMALGMAARAQADHPRAGECFTAALAAHPAHPWPADLLLQESREAGDWPAADALASRIMHTQPDHLAALNTRALAARARGDAPAAQGFLEAARLAHPGSLWAGDLLLDAYRAQSKWAEARALSAALLATRPDHPPALITLGQAAQAAGDRATALDLYRTAIRTAPTELWPRDLAMWAMRDTGDLAGADEMAQEALRIAPAHAAALLVRGLNARDRGDAAAAIAFLRAACAAAPRDPAPRQALLETLRGAGDWSAAGALLATTLAMDPRDAQARLEQARLARAQDDPATALALLRDLASTPERPLQARLELAALLADLGMTAQARAAFQDVLAEAPGHLESLLGLARAEVSAGGMAAAEDALAAGRRAHPLRIEPLLDLAELHWSRGDPVAAATLLSEARGLAPGDPRPLEFSGRHALQAENPPGAAALFREALALRPLSVSAHAGLIDALAASADFAAAAEAGEMAESRLGALPALRNARVAALHQQGHWPEALALACAPARPGEGAVALLLWRARLELLLQGPAAAEAGLARLAAHRPFERAEQLVLQGLAAEARWQMERAGGLFDAALEAMPRHAGAHWSVARNALLQLDLDAARRHLRLVMAQGGAARRAAGRSGNVSQSHAGQVMDEFGLDGPTLERLRAARRRPLAERVDELAAIVRAEPDHTAAACQLLLALRQSGRWPSGPPGDSAAAIPRHFCQYWNDPEPPADITALMESWVSQNPDFRLERYHDATAWEFLRRHCAPAVADAFRRAPEPAMRADLFRLAWLHAHGGVYADADDRCHAAMAPLLPPGRTLLLYLEDWATVGNNLIGAAAGDPIIGAALRQASTAILRGDRDMVWLSTGPGMLTREVARVAASEEGLPVSVALLDKETVQAVVAMHCHVAYKSSARHWSNSTFTRGAATRGGSTTAPRP